MSDVIVDAAKAGDLDRLQYLIEECHGDPNVTQGDDCYTALYWAACNGHSKVMCYLLDNRETDVNRPVKWGSTPLHAAAERGHCFCVIQLCKRDAIVNCQNYHNFDTPLHLAAYRGHLDVCRHLLSFGANITIQNKQGKTCLDEAHSQRKFSVYQYLLQYIQGKNKSDLLSTPTQPCDDIGFKPLNRKPTEPHPKTVSEPILASLTPSHNSSSKLPLNPAKISLKSDSFKSTAPTLSQVEYLEGKIMQDLLKGENQCSVQPPCKYCQREKYKEGRPQNEYFTSSEEKNSEINKYYKQYSSNGQRLNDINCDEKKELNVDGYLKEGAQVSDYVKQQICDKPTKKLPIFQEIGSTRNSNAELPNSPGVVPMTSPTQNYTHLSCETSYLKIFESLQLQLTKERDRVTFLEKKHLDLWRECESYRGRLIDQEKKVALSSTFEYKYKQTLEEIVRLKTRLNESDNRSRTLASALFKQQLATSGQNQAINSPAQPKSPEVRRSITIPAQTIFPEVQRSINNPAQTKSQEMDSIFKKEPAMIAKGTKQEGGTPAKHSGDSSSEDNLSSTAVHSQNDGENDSHSDLYSAILPVFQNLGGTFQRTMSRSLREQLRSGMTCWKRDSLDGHGREWVCGEHYVLNNSHPINRLNQAEGSCSLVFTIQHQNASYILKMMINVLDLSETKHGSGRSYPLYLYQQFSAEHDIPTLLPPHPNIVPVLHHFNGTTLPFKHLITTCFPPGLGAPLEMANETTFIVTPEYPSTLSSFFEVKSKHKNLPEKFILQKLYEILSAVNHLQENKVVHRDIKANNVFLDHELKAVLGDFGFARRVQNTNGSPIPLVENSQAVAGNSDAWTPQLAAVNTNGPELLERQVSLEELYHTTDSYAVGNMFFKLLSGSSLEEAPYQPEIPDCYSSELKTVIDLLRHSEISHRLDGFRGNLIVGLMMFGPRGDEVMNEAECHVWYHSKIMKLLVHKPVQNLSVPSHPNFVLSVGSSLSKNEDMLERHFFVNHNAEEIWKEYQELLSFKKK